MTLFGFKTIDAGEQAGEGQYLEVNQRNGPRLCLSGPTQLYLNPIEHESIHIKDAILVSANEALVV